MSSNWARIHQAGEIFHVGEPFNDKAGNVVLSEIALPKHLLLIGNINLSFIFLSLLSLRRFIVGWLSKGRRNRCL